MRFRRPSPRIGRLLGKSNSCEFTSPGACGGDRLNYFSDYATKYRPKLELVLKDISVAVVRLVSPSRHSS